MGGTSYFQQVIESVESLSTDEQDILFDLIKKRRIEARRKEIAQNARETIAAFKAGKGKRMSVAELKDYLLDEDETEE